MATGASTPKETETPKLVDIDLDKALQFADQIPAAQFMQETDRINFKLSDFNKLL
jgi:hypothetical protein